MVSVSAHRGLSHQFPENTLLAFDKAAAIGVDMVELDVHVTKDGEVVVSHDDNLERCSGKSGSIASLEFSDLESFDLGLNQIVPRLSTVLEIFKPTKVRVNIEVKVFEAEQKILDVVRSTGMEDQVMYSSFLFPVLLELHDLAPSAVLCPLIGDASRLTSDKLIAQAGGIDARYFNIGYKSITEALVDDFHAAGIGVQAWTPDAIPEFRHLIEIGVDVIITNEPDKLLRHLGRL